MYAIVGRISRRRNPPLGERRKHCTQIARGLRAVAAILVLPMFCLFGGLRFANPPYISIVAPAFAIEPEEQLKDPALEARARALSQELRCLVCENESIDASQVPLAGDLRRLVRERILAGDSDA